MTAALFSGRSEPRSTVGGRHASHVASQAMTRTMAVVVAIVVVAGYYVLTGNTYVVFLVNTSLLACIGALGLDLLMGTAGQVSIGNAAFLCVGGFTAVWASRAGVGFPYDVIVGAVACAVVGLVVGLPALRIRGIYLALATLAAFYVVEYYASRYQADTVGAGAFILNPVFGGTIASRGRTWSWVLVGVVVACLILVTWLRTGRSGRAWRMIRDHEVAAPAMGIPVARYKLIAFVISSAIIGVQGGLSAHFVGSLSADTFTLALSISAVAMILIGGLDSQLGPLVGAMTVTLLPTVVPSLINRIASAADASSKSGGYAEIAYGVLIVVFIVYSPRGVSGWLGAVGRRMVGILRVVRPPDGRKP